MALKTKSKISPRDRFKKRSSSTLEKTWKDKDKRSSSGGGKSIFNMELLEELGIKIFKPDTRKDGTYYGEILPPSFDDETAYFTEVPVHEMVGINNDNFICMKGRGQDCFRCIKQKQLYQAEYKDKSKTSQMYARDKVIYLWWDRTEEIGKDEDPKYEISVWQAIKTGIHMPLQSKVRDKKTRQFLDISDVSEDGDGRTIYFEVNMRTVVNEKTKQKMTLPQYENFDLLKRDDPIPDEIMDKLSEIIETLEDKREEHNRKNKFKLSHPLEVLLHFPEEGEIEDSMKTEVFDEPEEKTSSRKQINKRDKEEEKEEPEEEIPDLDKLEEELGEMNKFKLIRWAKEKGLDDQIDKNMEKDEMIEAILNYYSEMQD